MAGRQRDHALARTQGRPGAVAGAPVLSPSTTSADREVTLPVYARHGVRHAWLIDPRRKTLEVLELRAGAWQLAHSAEGNAPIRAAPFDAVEIPPPWA